MTYVPTMSQFGRFFWSKPRSYPAVLLDAVLSLGVILLVADIIDRNGWRGGLFFGCCFAAVRLVINSFVVWNNREPQPR